MRPVLNPSCNKDIKGFKENYTRLYKHDCDVCKYLGIYQNADLYYCDDTLNPTLLARFSSDPPNYSSSRVSELEYFGNDEFLMEALKRAIEYGYIPTEQVKGETDMCETTMVGPVVSVYDNTDHYDFNSELTQYIKDKKTGKKLGMIQAFKIGHLWFNDQCVNSAFKKTKPFVVIVHSKVRPNCEDVFDIGRADEICTEKCDFVIRVLSGQKQRRTKYMEEMPIKATLVYYKEMYDRARRYYKDCDEIVQYHEVFDFVEDDNIDIFVEEVESKILNNYNRLKNLVLEQRDSNFTTIKETKYCGGGNCSCKKE